MPPELMGVHFGDTNYLTKNRQLEGSPVSLGRSDALAESPIKNILTRYIIFFYEKRIITLKSYILKAKAIILNL